MEKIKEGDRVILNPVKNHGDETPGVIEHIYPGIHERVAIVNFPTGRRKMLLDELVVVTDAVTITRDKFYELTEKVLDRESLEISDGAYEMLATSAELIFKRLESLLFGGEND